MKNKRTLKDFRFRRTFDGGRVNLSFRQMLALNESYLTTAVAKEALGPRFLQTMSGLEVQGLFESRPKGWKRTPLGRRVALLIEDTF